MNKYLSVGAISASIVFGESCKSVKDDAINKIKDEIKKKDEEAMKYVKSLVNDESKVISHTNTLNSDELLNANLVFFGANAEEKKKVDDIFKKNLVKIKNSPRYGTNSAFYIFTFKAEKFPTVGIIEVDVTTLKPEAPRDKFCGVDGLDQIKMV